MCRTILAHACRNLGGGGRRKISLRITGLQRTEICHSAPRHNKAENICCIVQQIQFLICLSFTCQENKHRSSILLSNGFIAIKIGTHVSVWLTDIVMPERDFQHSLQLCGTMLLRRARDPLICALLILATGLLAHGYGKGAATEWTHFRRDIFKEMGSKQISANRSVTLINHL